MHFAFLHHHCDTILHVSSSVLTKLCFISLFWGDVGSYHFYKYFFSYLLK